MKLKHNNKGFSLVELIVVIAIMAILGGVGTVGYTKYIAYTNKKADVTTIKNVVRAIYTAGNSYAFYIDEVAQASSGGLQVPIGFIVLSNEDINGNGFVHILPEESPNNPTLIHDILSSTYGENYDTQLKLKSDTWNESTVSTMYADTEELYGDVKTLADLLANDAIRWLITEAGKTVGDYNSGVEAIAAVSHNFKSAYPSEDQFIEVWKKGNTNGNYAFGLNSSGLETYTAVRRSYNEAVANYVEKHSTEDHSTKKYNFTNWTGMYVTRSGYKNATLTDTFAEAPSIHADGIRNYGMSLGELVVSDTIRSSVFGTASGCDAHGGQEKTGTSLLGSSYKFYEEGDLKDNVQLCSTCQNLVAEYCTSSDAEADARAFYQTMETLDASSEKALSSEYANSNNPWGYYDSYINSFASMYSDLEEVTNNQESCVAITVYYNAETRTLTANPEVVLDN